MSTVYSKKRRVLLKGLIAFATAPVWGSFIPTALQAIENQSLQQFIQLSQRLTGESRLNQQVALNIWLELRDEQWGEDHLQRVINKLLPTKSNDDMDFSEALNFDPLDDGERWFTEHLTTTWLTGIYFHERGNKTISYRHALMHESLLDLRPVPGDCDRSFGFWQSPPENSHG